MKQFAEREKVLKTIKSAITNLIFLFMAISTLGCAISFHPPIKKVDKNFNKSNLTSENTSIKIKTDLIIEINREPFENYFNNENQFIDTMITIIKSESKAILGMSLEGRIYDNEIDTTQKFTIVIDSISITPGQFTMVGGPISSTTNVCAITFYFYIEDAHTGNKMVYGKIKRTSGNLPLEYAPSIRIALHAAIQTLFNGIKANFVQKRFYVLGLRF